MQLNHDIIKDTLTIFVDSEELNIYTTDVMDLLSDKYEEKSVIFNMEKMMETGLIDFCSDNYTRIASPTSSGYYLTSAPMEILMPGLSYYDVVKNESFFEKVKSTMKNQALEITIELGKMYLKELGKQALGLGGD